MKKNENETKTSSKRMGERLLQDELAPAVIGAVSRRAKDNGRDLEMLTGNLITQTVESFTTTSQRGPA